MSQGTCLLISLRPLDENVPGGIRTRKHLSCLARMGWKVFALCLESKPGGGRRVQLVEPPEFQRFAMQLDESNRPPKDLPQSTPLPPGQWSWGAGSLRCLLRGAQPKRYLPLTDGWPLGVPLREFTTAAAAMGPDVIFSTSPPVYCHVVAGKVARALNKPWVAELRDLWADNWGYRKAGPLYRLEAVKEVRTLSSAHSLVTVNEPMAEYLRHRHGKKVQVVFPSFWPEDPGQKAARWPMVPPLPLRLLFTGRFYDPGRMPHTLFAAIASMLQRGEIQPQEISVEVYSPNAAQLASFLEREFGSAGPRLLGICRVHEPVPHEQVKPLLESHHLLLSLGAEGQGSEGVITSKVAEYVGSGTPILAMGDEDGYMMRVVEDTGTGFVATTEESCAEVLGRAVEMARRGERIGRPAPDAEAIAGFSTPRQVERLAALLEQAAAGRA